MSVPPPLFDTGLLSQRRRRAERAGFENFLHERVCAGASERLLEVNRSFRHPAVVGPRAGFWAERLAESGLPPAERIADSDVLALEPGAHDLIVHALGMHWANDPVGQLIQARRALSPDGLFLAALFGGDTLSELRETLGQAEIEISGGLSPRIAPMGRIRDLGALLQRAGFTLPVADSERIDVSYQTPLHLMRDLRAMGETNVQTARSRTPMRREILARTCELYASAHSDADGRIRATFEVIWLTGWVPHESQQKPLRPGSAATRLAEALGTQEISAGEKPGPEGS